MIKRKYWTKVPLQGNFYPMPTAAYLEDDTHRLSLLSAQALGVANLEKGELEVMLDRRLMQDDNRGLFQGVQDNHPTPSAFRLLLQAVSGLPPASESKLGQLTLREHYASQILDHPFHALIERQSGSFDPVPSYNGLKQNFPCDVDLVNLRHLALPAKYSSSGVEERLGPETALIVRKVPLDCRSSGAKLSCSLDAEISLASLFTELTPGSAERRSLTLSHPRPDPELDSGAKISLRPMDIAAYRLRLA